MPQRFLRPGITNSARWNAVDAMAGNLFVRLLTLVDDFGRTDGRSSVILGACFSVWNECHPAKCCKLQQVADMLRELVLAGLIDIYEADGKRVLQIVQWQERIREGCKAKWPDKPESAATCSDLLPSSPSSPPSPTPSFSVPEAANAAVREEFEKWMKVRRGMGKKPDSWADMFAEQFRWLSKFPDAQQIDILSQSIRNRWQGLFEKGTGNNGANSKPTTKGSSRTYGTANERRIGQYEGVGKV